jgi:hypothetical protein
MHTLYSNDFENSQQIKRATLLCFKCPNQVVKSGKLGEESCLTILSMAKFKRSV